MKSNELTKTYEDLMAGLKELGVKGRIKPAPIRHHDTLLVVHRNGSYFGIWDTERKTFVD